MDNCPFCGADGVNNYVYDIKSFDCGTDIIRGGVFERGTTCYETETANLKALVREMGKALVAVPHFLEDDAEELDKQIDETLTRPEVKAIMNESPDSGPHNTTTVDLDEFACLKVRKSTMPPGASLVVCYDDGSGIPTIDDDRYPDFVVV